MEGLLSFAAFVVAAVVGGGIAKKGLINVETIWVSSH